MARSTVSTRSVIALVALTVLGAAALVAAPRNGTNDQPSEHARVGALCREIQPLVAEITGFESGKPVPVEIRSRSEVREYLIELVEKQYAGRELQLWGRCLAEIGLLPRGYDLEAGLVQVITEQAGGLYDPYDKVFIAIDEIHEAPGSEATERLVIGHELAHALQDRVTDLVEISDAVHDDADAEYGFRAVMEGTAMVVGMAVAQDAGLDELGDVGAMLRASFRQFNATMGTLAASPLYVQEFLLGPYVDGSVLVQAYLADHPDATMADLFAEPPATAEQALHYDKYVAGDDPTEIDLGAVDRLLPGSWQLTSANTLGEFEVKVLCQSHEATRASSMAVAAGWDGIRVAAYETGDGRTVVVGSSAWDSLDDADEFEGALVAILSGIHGTDGFEVLGRGDRVSFVTGMAAAEGRSALLDALSGATPTQVATNEVPAGG